MSKLILNTFNTVELLKQVVGMIPNQNDSETISTIKNFSSVIQVTDKDSLPELEDAETDVLYITQDDQQGWYVEVSGDDEKLGFKKLSEDTSMFTYTGTSEKSFYIYLRNSCYKSGTYTVLWIKKTQLLLYSLTNNVIKTGKTSTYTYQYIRQVLTGISDPAFITSSKLTESEALERQAIAGQVKSRVLLIKTYIDPVKITSSIYEPVKSEDKTNDLTRWFTLTPMYKELANSPFITVATVEDFPEDGDTSVLYFVTATNTFYRWEQIEDEEGHYVPTSQPKEYATLEDLSTKGDRVHKVRISNNTKTSPATIKIEDVVESPDDGWTINNVKTTGIYLMRVQPISGNETPAILEVRDGVQKLYSRFDIWDSPLFYTRTYKNNSWTNWETFEPINYFPTELPDVYDGEIITPHIIKARFDQTEQNPDITFTDTSEIDGLGPYLIDDGTIVGKVGPVPIDLKNAVAFLIYTQALGSEVRYTQLSSRIVPVSVVNVLTDPYTNLSLAWSGTLTINADQQVLELSRILQSETDSSFSKQKQTFIRTITNQTSSHWTEFTKLSES